MKNFFKNTLLLDEETTYFDRNIWKLKKIVANSSDESFK